MVYPALEARRVSVHGGHLVAVINHATGGPPVTARLPWLDPKRARVTELTGAGGPLDGSAPVSFAPLEVRLFRYDAIR